MNWRELAYYHVSDLARDRIYEEMAREDINKIREKLRYTLKDHRKYREEYICELDRYAKKMLDYASRSGYRFYSIAYDYACEEMDGVTRLHEVLERRRKHEFL